MPRCPDATGSGTDRRWGGSPLRGRPVPAVPVQGGRRAFHPRRGPGDPGVGIAGTGAAGGARDRGRGSMALDGPVVAAAGVAPPGFEPSELQVVDLSSPAATLLWEAGLPAAITVVLRLAAMRVLTGTAGGTGALLMGLGLITAFQFLGILAWATSGAVEFLGPTPGVAVGIAAGALLFVAGGPSPPQPGGPPPPPPVAAGSTRGLG